MLIEGKSPQLVSVLGPPGVGKAHLASALGLVAAQHRFSTYYVNCHQLIEQLKKAHFENRLPDKLRVLAKYRMLIIDEIGYLPMDIQGANLFFQLIARRYEKTSTVFTSNKTFSQWNEVFADVTIASAILDKEKELEDKTANTSMKISGYEQKGDAASISVTITNGDDISSQRIHFIRISNTWYLSFT